jgi:hypothetical protein
VSRDFAGTDNGLAPSLELGTFPAILFNTSPTVGDQTMQPADDSPSGEPGFSVSGHSDPFTAGDSVLDRAKSVSQQITQRVRELMQDTERSSADDGTDEHKPLPE